MKQERQRLVYEVTRRAARGESIRGIARVLGIARKTVRRILRDAEERRRRGDDVYLRAAAATRTPRASKLDPHTDFIAELLATYPDIRATRLLEELQAKGFDGGYTIVREYLKKVRPKFLPRTFHRVETAPGQQAQVDWSPYKLADGTPIYCFSAVLCDSRYQYASFCADMRQPTLFRQLIKAFETFGGVPSECVFDSMPGIVDRWELERPVLNLGAIDFAVYYNFELHIAPRADGAYKGKVERPFRYIEESLLNARTFHSIEEANETMRWWLEHRANSRCHATTKRVPAEALLEERPHLGPLPVKPYDARELAYRLVDPYGYVSFDGNHYRAPVSIGSWIYVRAGEDEVAIVRGAAEVIARHQRRPRGAEAWVPPPQKKERRRPIKELLACFEAWGPSALRYAERLRHKKRYAGAELASILKLQESYSAEDLLGAIDHAARYGAYEASAVERILEATATPRTFEDRIAEQSRIHVRRAMAQAPVRQRELADYARLLRPADDHEEDHGDEDEHHRPEEDGEEEDTP